MIDYLDGSGFLGTHGSVGADASLVIMLAAAVLLSVGVVLAKSRRYSAHRWVQTLAVCVSAAPIAIWMIRSLWLYVLPDLPGVLAQRAYLVTSVHAVVGIIGVTIGVFVVVRSTQLEARHESLARYKNLMRAAYGVYMLGTALGVWTYVAIYA